MDDQSERSRPWTAALSDTLGDAERVSVSITSAELTSGDKISFVRPGVTAIVGANNSGKSALLRQIYALILQGNASAAGQGPVITRGIEVAKTGTSADLVEWLGQHATYRELPGQLNGTFYRQHTSGIVVSNASATWNLPNLTGELTPFLVHYADASGRLGQPLSSQQRGDVEEPPTHPLHHLQDDADLRQRLDGISRRIFRQPLTFDDRSGNMRLRVGEPDLSAPPANESQGPYRAALAKLPILEHQGDGMKSLLGLLLPLVAATYRVVIVDEPEAFLHPPQAYALGRVLGELSQQSDTQIIVATHDKDFLAGLLFSEVALSVVRLTRVGNLNHVSSLPSDRLREFWSNPVLRYSNVLDGLFHQLVVLAEGEDDCRFLAAAIDVADADSDLGLAPSDVLFVPSHGKGGMVELASVLGAISVPTIASPDLDILNDSGLLQRLLTALGRNWDQVEHDYNIATETFRQPRERVRVADIKQVVVSILDEVLQKNDREIYGAAVRDRIYAALRSSESPWQALKDYGDRAFKGQAAEAAARLLPALDQLGVVAVSVGELEGFAPGLGVSKGPRWLPAALLADAHKAPAVQAHINRIIASWAERYSSLPAGGI